MAEDEDGLAEQLSLAWSTAGLVASPEQASNLWLKMSGNDFSNLLRMHQIPGRSRALIAIALSLESKEELETCLEELRKNGIKDKWELAIWESLRTQNDPGGILDQAIKEVKGVKLDKEESYISSAEMKYMEGSNKKTKETKKDFKVRIDYRRSDLLKIQLPSQRSSPDIGMRRPSLKLTPKLNALKGDMLQRKGSLLKKDTQKVSNALKENYATARRPKMILDDDDTAIDPDSVAATILRDEQKKKEKEALAEKRRLEAEERKKEREREREKRELQKKTSKSKADDKNAKNPKANNVKGKSADEDANGALKRKLSSESPSKRLRRRHRKGQHDLSSDEDDSNEPEEKPVTAESKLEESPTTESKTDKQDESVKASVNQTLGTDLNALTDEDRTKITHFLCATKNIFKEGEDKKSFVLHRTIKESSDPELAHIVESIVFEATREGQWRKLRKKRQVRKDEVET